jgi:ATP-dependent Clp protease ATP-binding subunit ClpX
MSNKLFKVLDEYIYFDDAYESQEYAKNNPGKTVIRNPDAHESERIYQEPRKQAKMSKSPNMILKYLNEHVISQDKAKKDIALAMYYHSLKSQYSSNTKIGTNGPVMIVGSTGSGKTFIVQKACEYIDTVFIHVDTSSMVPEGIKGYSIINLVEDILIKANYDFKKASHCVVFFDEMDKLFISDDPSDYGDRVVTQLLRFIEGSKIQLSAENSARISSKNVYEFDTSNIQFILGGAFQWVLDAKSENKTSMGFNNTNNNPSTNEITLEDLYKEEIPKELLGRMSTIVNLQKLSEDDYYKILTNSKSSPLQEFINKVEFHGDQVDISNETLLEISKMAADSELGVRAIKQTLNILFTDALFSTADGEFKTHVIKF